jgi:hypothetical protein
LADSSFVYLILDSVFKRCLEAQLEIQQLKEQGVTQDTAVVDGSATASELARKDRAIQQLHEDIQRLRADKSSLLDKLRAADEAKQLPSLNGEPKPDPQLPTGSSSFISNDPLPEGPQGVVESIRRKLGVGVRVRRGS